MDGILLFTLSHGVIPVQDYYGQQPENLATTQMVDISISDTPVTPPNK